MSFLNASDGNAGPVNLLPQWYVGEERDKRSVRVRLMLMLALGAAMVGWTGVGRAQLHQLAIERDRLAAQQGQVRDMSADVRRRETEVSRLRYVQGAIRELGVPVPMSRLIQQVQNEMTPGMALSRLALDVRNEPVKGSGVVGDLRNPPRYHEMARLTVVGIGPNDVQIMQLIGKLSAHPLFTDVSLNYTRSELLQDYAVRRFEMQMACDLEPMRHAAPPRAASQPAAATQLTEAADGH